MALPESVRVKISSEEAGSISITQVVSQQMPIRDLVELILGSAGKDAKRVHEVLLRGTTVSGASRFRWQGWDAVPAGITELLGGFPDPDPARPFDASRCVFAILRGAACRIDLSREACMRRRFLRRRSFWECLLEAVAEWPLEYVDYSYRDRADLFLAPASPALLAAIRAGSSLLPYPSLAAQLLGAPVEVVELYVAR
jgi:hypothetical protein